MHSTRIVWLIATATCAVLLAFLGPGPAAALGHHPDDAVWPLSPRPEVVADFDPPARDWNAGHRGVDLAGTPGQGVRAAKQGRVTYAGLLAGRGIVVISHGDTRTTYQPVQASVRVGAMVTTGQRVGVLRAAGSHCWPRTCLHWGLIRGETYLDPLTLVGAGPVRLLPLFPNLATFGLLALGLPAPALPAFRPTMDLPGPRRNVLGIVPAITWSRPAGELVGRHDAVDR